MSIEFRVLSSQEQQALDKTLEFGSRIAGKNGKLSIDDVNTLYKSFLHESIQEPSAIIALGLSFGQLFVDNYKFEWVRINDEYGEETAIAPKGKKINISPISMIQKRLSDKTELDIGDLLNDTMQVAQELIDSGNYDDR